MGEVADKVRATLTDSGAEGEIIWLTVDVPTAAAAAAELGCEVGAIANSLVFEADGAPVLILTSGAHRVDTAHVARALDVSKLRRATPEFVLEHTAQKVGGVAPVGHPHPIRTLVDTWLQKYERVWAAGGEAACVFPTTFDELLHLTGGTPMDVEP
ncbi:YbaK/EbsC family protein [Actinobacteria bacterium YIM 96077]|uniref:YbaK/EbsC family protein n=2 Tax=Phytoactinopolyspora halophila TaxID=1981511 RepID=A0A329QEE6_9ACTN|nr:YbaK/EbsC family protein [Actinobacteria bacterium YIM 96077]RAW09602.1 YbaK/EbsC family protein [Phytoactinopolyspora halophila]